MIVHQVYALISEEKVQNICVCDNYEMANHLARAAYGDEAFAVDCLQYRCFIGDAYRDRLFFHIDEETGEETLVEYVPTQEQQVYGLTEELTSTQLALVESYEENIALQEEVTNTQLALVESYEENLVLQEEVLYTQLALCELYEGGLE